LRILNHYGPTEATVGAVAHELDDASRDHRPGTVPIGRPLAGGAVYVLDAERQPVPVGVSGTLFVAGAGVASGYVGQPELTAERFSDDPFRPGRRMYDTGDLVRWLPSGELEFIGRADEQVKIRGYRVEPAEVESALRSHPGVQDAVVVTQPSPAGDARLVAYVGADGVVADRPSADELAAHVAAWVPEFMVPSAVVVLDSLPRTPSGKIDVQSLPDPADVAAPAEEFVAPRSPMEEAVAGIWTRVLGVPEVGVKDDFFTSADTRCWRRRSSRTSARTLPSTCRCTACSPTRRSRR
jgi:acyl-coenzyme A synthetase/AMP-(fatty) acid ligase